MENGYNEITGIDTGIDTELFLVCQDVVLTNKLHSQTQLNNFTISDVAEQAGVSVSTVSRILNQRPDVSAQTREHVEQVISRLAYSPQIQARSLRAGSMKMISLLYPFNQDGSLVELDLIMGALKAAADNGYLFNLVVNPLNDAELLGLFRSGQTEGVILEQVNLTDWRVDLLKEAGCPFVMVGRTSNSDGCNYVELDKEACILKAFEHLVDLGHRQIGFLSYPREGMSPIDSNNFGPFVYAMAGYEKALSRFGLARFHRPVSFTVDDQAKATLELLEENREITAIVIADGFRAAGVYNALCQRGYRIPEDVSVIGIATDTAARMFMPKLTSIDLPLTRLGYRAGEILINDIQQDGKGIVQQSFEPELILRQTTGLVRSC